jgi:hypothetical protein
MRAQEFLNELKINNATGIGAVPHNADVDYHGLRVTMRPSMFLRLALPLDRNDSEERKAIEYCKSQLDDPGIGAPFLTINAPEAWESDDFSLEAKVRDHDGRHRCYAILGKEGNGIFTCLNVAFVASHLGVHEEAIEQTETLGEGMMPPANREYARSPSVHASRTA